MRHLLALSFSFPHSSVDAGIATYKGLLWLPFGFNEFSPHNDVRGPRVWNERVVCMGRSHQRLAHILWALEFASSCGYQRLTAPPDRVPMPVCMCMNMSLSLFLSLVGVMLSCCWATSCHIGFCGLKRAQRQWRDIKYPSNAVIARRWLAKRCLKVLWRPYSSYRYRNWGPGWGGNSLDCRDWGRTFQKPHPPTALVTMAHHCRACRVCLMLICTRGERELLYFISKWLAIKGLSLGNASVWLFIISQSLEVP